MMVGSQIVYYNFLKNNFGFDNDKIAQTLETMKLMENIGLSQLTQITEDQQSSIINNKDRHKNTFDTLVAGANQ